MIHFVIGQFCFVLLQIFKVTISKIMIKIRDTIYCSPTVCESWCQVFVYLSRLFYHYKYINLLSVASDVSECSILFRLGASIWIFSGDLLLDHRSFCVSVCLQYTFSGLNHGLLLAFCISQPQNAVESVSAWEERWSQVSVSTCLPSLWDLGPQVQATLVALSFKFYLHRLIRLPETWLRHWAFESPLHIQFLCCAFHTAAKSAHGLRGLVSLHAGVPSLSFPSFWDPRL